MKKMTFLLLLWITAIGYAGAQENSVPYTEGKRYFVKNTYPERELHMLKITDKTVFEEIFGMATVMGEGGQPTPVDFSESFVIALIDKTSHDISPVRVKSLTQFEDRLQLLYEWGQVGEPGAASFRFCTVLIVDNKYMGTVTANCYTAEGDEQIVGCDLDEMGCKPSAGTSWSMLENNCIHPWSTTYALEAGRLQLSLIFNDDRSKAEIIGLNHTDAQYKYNTILEKDDANVWTKGNLSLTEVSKDVFVLTGDDTEIAKGRLR